MSVKQNIFFLLFIFLFVNTADYCEVKDFAENNDSSAYRTALEFIKNDTLYIREILSPYLDTVKHLKFNIYDNIVFIPLVDFGSKIIEYESQHLDSVETSRLTDYLIFGDTSQGEPYYWYYLAKLSEDEHSRLLLGFSRIRGNRLSALVFWESYESFDFKYNFQASNIFVLYLFYFANDKIIKVFKSEGLH